MSESIVAIFCMGWLSGALTALIILALTKKGEKND